MNILHEREYSPFVELQTDFEPQTKGVSAASTVHKNHRIAANCDQTHANIMAKKTSQKKTFVPKPSQKKGLLLKLPGEIRTQIYEYLLDDYRVEVIRAKHHPRPGRKQPHSYRLCHNKLNLRFGEGFDSRYSATPPVQLALTCRRFYEEMLLPVYANTYFVFRSPQTVHMFLNRINRDAQCAIRHIELYHTTYYEPKSPEHRAWKRRADSRWLETCRRLSESLPSLRTVHIDLRLGDWPIQLTLSEPWARPFHCFRNLLDARVDLLTGYFHPKQTRQACKDLERAMMAPSAWKAREDKYKKLSENRLENLDKLDWREHADWVMDQVLSYPEWGDPFSDSDEDSIIIHMSAGIAGLGPLPRFF